jgi:hypothetical protein
MPPVPPRKRALAVQAARAYTACMQYTLRNVPAAVDKALREQARREGRSLNDVALEALARACGLTGDRVRHRDVSFLRMSPEDAAALEAALAEQRTIDDEDWK